MASNLIIANPGIKDGFLVSATNYDIVNMATSPGQDIGGQSYQSYGSSWVKTRDTVYEDALLELKTNNMLTLAGNYVSSSQYGAYNLYYMINGVAQKEISGAKFSGNGGSINFSAQTGGAYVTKSGSLSEKPLDHDIRIFVDQGGTIAPGASPDDFDASLNYSSNGVYSTSGLLTVTGDLSADVEVNSNLTTSYLQKNTTLTNNNSDNVGNASAFHAQQLLISNNFTGNLAETVQYKGTSAYTGFRVDNNTAQAHGILVETSLLVNGYFGNQTSSGLVGSIVSTANNSSLLADGIFQPDVTEGEKQGRSAYVTGNKIGAYGLRAGDASSLSYSGSITLGQESGLFGAYGYNGSISTTANNNSFRALAYGNSPTGSFTMDVSNNSIRSIGIAAQTLTVNGQFLGSITSTAQGNYIQRQFDGEGATVSVMSGNELWTVGIYVANLVANNTFAGNFTVTSTGNYGFSDTNSERIFSYGIYATGSITVNGANLLASPVSGVGILDSSINVTVTGSDIEEVAGIDTGKLIAEAFSGKITISGGGQGMAVTSFSSGSDGIFDLNGTILVDRGYGINTASLMNMRVSGEISLENTILGNYAIYNDDGSIAGSKNDTLQIAAGAVITGNIELGTGSNYIYIDSNATVTGDLLASNGQLNITVALNQYGSVDNTSVGDHYSEDAGVLPTTAILQTSGSTMGSAQSGISINLNNAKAGTYKIASGTLWGLEDEKSISLIYNRNNPEQSTHKLSFLDGGMSSANGTVQSIDGDTLNYRIWLQQEYGTVSLYITVEGDSVYGRKEEIQNFAGVYSEGNESVTFSWDQMSLDSQTSFELEYSVNGGKSIVVMLAGTQTSYTIHNILAGKSVSARIRLNTSNGVLYSKWYGAEGSDREGLVVNAIPESDVSYVVGKVDDGNTEILPGNASGATSTVIDLGWQDVAADCTYGLSHYEMRFIVTDENITDSSVLEAIWNNISETYPDSLPAAGYAFSVSVNGQTYQGTVYSKTVTTNHVIISNLNDNQFYYWQVQAYDTKGNAGGWTDGVRFKVNTTDQDPPILDPDAVKVNSVVGYDNEWTWDDETQTFSGGWNVTSTWQNVALDYGSGIDKYMWVWSPEGNPSLQDRGYTYVPSDASSSQELSYTTKWLSLDYSTYNASLSVWDLTGQESLGKKNEQWIRDTTGPTGSFTVDNLESSIDVTPYSVSITAGAEPKLVDASGKDVLMVPQNVNITLDLSGISDDDSDMAMFTLSYREVGSSSWIYYSHLDTREENYDKTWTITDSGTFSGSKNYEFLITAYDKAGNTTAFTEDLFSVAGDTTAPVFSTTPNFAYNADSRTYTIVWDSATDETGVAFYQVQVYNESGSQIQAQYISSNDPLVCTITNAALEDKFTVTITAYDWLYTTAAAADKEKHFSSVTVNVEEDTEPPVFNDPAMNYHVHYSVVNGTLLQVVDLSWKSAEDSGSGVDGYWISYRKQGETEWSTPVWAKHSEGTSALTLSDPALVDGNYEWQVIAVDKRGNESLPVSGTWQKDTLAPTFAEGAAGTHGDVAFVGGDLAQGSFAQVQVTVSWTVAADAAQTVDSNTVDPSGIQGYLLEYRYKLPTDADFGAWYTVNSTENLITGTTYTLNPETLAFNFGNADYQWRVQAVDWSGNVSGYLEGDSVEGWTGDVTAPVFDGTNLGSVVVTFENGTLNATVSWTPGSDDSSGLYGYKLYYRLAGATFDWTAANDGNFIAYDSSLKLYTYQITGLTPANGSYEWMVVAYDKVGNMTDETAVGTFDGDINAPTMGGEVSAQVLGYVGEPGEDWKQNVTITWSPADDSSSDGSVSSGVEYYTLQFKVTSDPDSAYDANSYKVYLAADPNDPNRYVLENVNSPYVNLYEDLGILIDNGDYTIRILATDKAGNTTAVADGLTASWVGDHEGPVFTVDHLTGADVEYVLSGDTSLQNVTITWNPADDGGASGIRGYTIRYKLNDESVKEWNEISGLLTDTTYTFTNLAHGNYVFEITAYDNVGNSTVVSSSWNGDVTAPVFPRTDVTVTVDTDNNVTFNWKAPAVEDASVTPQSGVKEYIFTLHREGASLDEQDIEFTLSDPSQISYTISSNFWNGYQDGSYSWSIVAVDYAGNKSAALTGDSFIIDRDAPHGPNGEEGHFTSLPEPTITVEYNWFPQPGIEGPEEAVQVRDPATISITFDASNHTYEDASGVYFIYQISLDQTFQDDSKLLYNSLTEYSGTAAYEGSSLVLSTENNGITRLAGYAPGTTFYWRVKAVDGRGHEVANWSQQVTPFQLKDSSGEYDIDIVDIYTNPTTPENVSVTENAVAGSEFTHRISWIPSFDTFGIQGYNIEISNQKEVGYHYLPADEISTNNLYVSGAYLTLNSGTYYFRVQAVDGSGRTSDWSDKIAYTVSEDVYTGDGSSSDVAFVLDNITPGTNYYTTTAAGELGLATETKLNGIWYKFDLPNEGKLDINGRPLGGVLNLSLTGVTSKVTVTICDDLTKKTIKKFTVKSGSGGVSNLIIDPAKYGDRIYVYVEGDKNTTRAQYTINGSMTFFESPDYDALKTNPQSLVLTTTGGSASGTVSDWVGYQDKGDYFMVQGNDAATIQGVNITGVTGKLKVTLYDNAWKKKASVTITQDAYGLFSGQLIPELYFIAVETTDSGKGKVNSYYNLSVTEDYLPAKNPSSNPANAVSLDANGYYASTNEWVGYSDAVDYYSFSTAHAGALNVSINVKQDAKLKVTLYQFVNGKQKKLKSVTVKYTTNNTNLFKDYLTPVGDFLITVESGDKGKGKENSYYDLTISDQYKHPASSNSSFAAADRSTLIVNQKTTAANDLWVGYGDPVDYYEINLAGDGVFNLGVYDLGAKAKVYVYEKKAEGVAGKKLASATLYAGTNTDSAFKKDLLLDSGSYYVVVESGDKKTAKQETAYNLNFNGSYFVNDSHVNDNSVWDTDTVAQTQTLAANETIQLSGWVGYNDASDFFRFDVSGSSAVRLDFSNFNSTNLKYEVRSVDTNKKVSFDKYGVSKDQLSGAYYVEISTKSEKKYYSNDFTLGITSI